MNYIIYMADKSICFTSDKPPKGHYVIDYALPDDLLLSNILKILETTNNIAVYTNKLNEAYEVFVAQFVMVEAAGGAVLNPKGELMMILRNNRWDLPKGHLESLESLEQCAVREVEEETGVGGLSVVRHLCDTYHFYFMHQRWELKRTYWYEMRTESTIAPKPQTEEGIERVVWCSKGQVAENIKNTFPTIVNVVNSLC